MKTLFFLFAMMLFSINLYSAPPDSCLKYYFEIDDTTFFNPDSVMVDSCDGSPTFGVYYGKKYFLLEMQYKDTIIKLFIRSKILVGKHPINCSF